MDIKFDFNPEEIAKELHQAIANSTFKTMFEEAAKKEIERLNSGGYMTTRLIEGIVNDFLRRQMNEILETQYKEKIVAAIKQKFDAETFTTLCDSLIEKIEVKSRY